MTRRAGSFTIPAANPTLTVVIPFNPTHITFRGGPSSGFSSVVQSYNGVAVDGGNQNVVSNYADSTTFATRTSQTKCISLYDMVSGTLTEVVGASYVGHPSSGTGFVLNATSGSPTRQVFYDADDL